MYNSYTGRSRNMYSGVRARRAINESVSDRRVTNAVRQAARKYHGTASENKYAVLMRPFTREELADYIGGGKESEIADAIDTIYRNRSVAMQYVPEISPDTTPDLPIYYGDWNNAEGAAKELSTVFDCVTLVCSFDTIEDSRDGGRDFDGVISVWYRGFQTLDDEGSEILIDVADTISRQNVTITV